MSRVKIALILLIPVSWLLCSIGMFAMRPDRKRNPFLELVGVISWMISGFLVEGAVFLVLGGEI